jgi:glycosyltransferase involved in cell wall biosynthesis
VIKINYVAPVKDASGYSNAARNYIGALTQEGIEVNINPVSFEKDHTNHGFLDAIINPRITRDMSAPITLLHMTPENYPRFMTTNQYTVAVTVWETDKLHPTWVPLLNACHEVWVPSNFCVEVFKASGVAIPIYMIPHTINTQQFTSPREKKVISGLDDTTYVFYSIFQWLERKNPGGLITSYLTEFTPQDNVALVLKTYKFDSSLQQKDWVKQQIANIRSLIRQDYFPPIHFIGDLLDQDGILDLHTRGDCFALTSRAEGFSLTHLEAMAIGKPTIGANYGGSLDFMNSTNSILIDGQQCPVMGMPFSIYTSDQSWLAPSILSTREKMRWAYSNREAARSLGNQAKQDIKDKYDWSVIGPIMKSRLEEITRNLNLG